MHRSLKLLVVFGLVSTQCVAEDAWTEFLQGWKQGDSRYRAPWTLLVRENDQPGGFARRDEVLFELISKGDLRVNVLDRPSALRLWEAKSWSPEAHWILLNKPGNSMMEGTGTPSGSGVKTFLQSVGYRTIWEVQEAFLRAHPDNGDALEARLTACFRLVRHRFRLLVDHGKARQVDLSGGVPGKLRFDTNSLSVSADDLYKETAETLERLIQVPDWWRLSDRYSLGLMLQSFDAGASPRMRAILSRLRDSLLIEWQRNPSYGSSHDGMAVEEGNDLFGLGTIWIQFERTIEGGRVGSLPTMRPSPGQSWPPWDLVLSAFELQSLSQDWEGALGFLDKLPLEPPEPPILSASWEKYLALRSLVASCRTLALAHLGRWDEARLSALETRHWMGAGWKANSLLDTFTPAPIDGQPVKEPAQLGGAERIVAPRDFCEILRSEPEPKIPPPIASGPIRMVIRGVPSRKQAWLELSQHPALTVWGPDELQWEVATEEDDRILGRIPFRADWAAIKDGSIVLAAGGGLPEFGPLVLQLAAGGPAKLQRLGEFIRRNPDHLDARRERTGILLNRMPNPVLEPSLAEDVAAVWIPPSFPRSDDWKPNPVIWGPWAIKRMPEIEEALRRWPRSVKLWNAWLAWSEFLPRKRSVHSFALSLDVLGSRPIWLAALPKEIHDAVAKELQGHRQWEAMRSWFQDAWDGLDSEPSVISPDVAEGRRECIYKHLREVLSTLQLRDSMAELNRKHRARRDIPD